MTVVFAAAALIVGVLGAVLAMIAMSRARRMAAATAKRIRSELIASGPLDPRAVRDVAVVRYDALEEMAGQLSFSVAMLNAHGDGVVLTSINGRTETRTYAKVVADGKGVHQLSPEEQQAVRSAQLGHGPPTLLTQAPRLVGGHGPVRPATAADAERVRAGAQHATHGPGEADRVRAPQPGSRASGEADRVRAAQPGSGDPGEADRVRAAQPGSRGPGEPDGRRAAAATAAGFTPRREAPDGQRSASAGDGAKPGKPEVSTTGTAPTAEGYGARAGAPAPKSGPSGTKPEGAKLEGAQPERAKPDAAKLEGAKPDGAKAEGAKPASAKAEGAKAEGAKPEGAKPDAAKPESDAPAAKQVPAGEKAAPAREKAAPGGGKVPPDRPSRPGAGTRGSAKDPADRRVRRGA